MKERRANLLRLKSKQNMQCEKVCLRLSATKSSDTLFNTLPLRVERSGTARGPDPQTFSQT